MAYEISNYSVKVSLVANADLSTHQYKLVKMNTNGRVELCAAVTDKPIGVLQNNPVSGGVAEVLIVGGTKVVLGGTVAVGASIGTNATGVAVAKTFGTDTTHFVLGQAVTGGASGEIVTAVINGANAGRAA